MTDREQFTTGVLLSLVTEMADAKEHLQHIEASIFTLAKEYGVKIPGKIEAKVSRSNHKPGDGYID